MPLGHVHHRQGIDPPGRHADAVGLPEPEPRSRQAARHQSSSGSLMGDQEQPAASLYTGEAAVVGQPAASEEQPAAPGAFLYSGEAVVAKELRTKLTCVRVAPHVTEISDYALLDSTNLVEVHLNEGLQIIGYGAFERCSRLGSVTMPSTVAGLADRAFYGCSSLTDVQLNEDLQVIGEDVFGYCTALRSVTVYSTITELSTNVFYKCSNLAEVKFNEGLRIIGEEAFGYCTSLRRITLPSSVKKLGKEAFYGWEQRHFNTA